MERKIVNLLVSVEDYFLGGRSVCRNRTLQKMFMFIGNGERAGSGADTITHGWKFNNWPEPKIEERFQPDMVDLTLFIGSTAKTTQKLHRKPRLGIKSLILSDAEIIGITRDGINYHLRNMRGVSIVRRNGDNGGL